MDAATHALAGFALGRAGLTRLSPLAIPLAVAGAAAPDVDELARLAGPLAYFEWSRSVTHSWLVAPLSALAIAWIVTRIAGRKGPSWRDSVVAFVGVASHIVLDAVTLPGVAWFWPLSSRYYSADLTVTGDPWPGLVLLFAVIVPFLSGLVSSEIGARRSSGAGWAVAALVGVAIYFGVRFELRQQAVVALESRIYDGRPARRAAAIPEPWNPLSWRGLVDTGESLREIPVDLTLEFDPDAGSRYFPPERTGLVDEAKGTSLYRKLAPRLSWPRWEVIPIEDGTEVGVEDLRLGEGAVFLLGPGGQVREERYNPP